MGFSLRPSSNCDSARPERCSRIAFASIALTSLTRLLERDARLQPTHHHEPRPRAVVQQIHLRLNRGIHHHRQPEVERLADDVAAEARRRDADDRHRDVVHAHDAADRGARPREAALPIVVREDRDGILPRRLVFRRGEGAARVRGHAEHGKEIAGHESCVRLFGGCIGARADLHVESDRTTRSRTCR